MPETSKHFVTPANEKDNEEEEHASKIPGDMESLFILDLFK